jgi:hypothetical protein
MRDISKEIFMNQPIAPMKSAHQDARPSLRKRFYERAQTGGASAEAGSPCCSTAAGAYARAPSARHAGICARRAHCG